MGWMVTEPSIANFNAFVSSCGHCFMYSLGPQVGNAIIAPFGKSYLCVCVYIYTHPMSLLLPFKRRTCFLQASRLRCISPPWCVVSWVIKFLCGEIRQPPEGFMSVSLCRLCICFFVILVNCAGGVWRLGGRGGAVLFVVFWLLHLVTLKSDLDVGLVFFFLTDWPTRRSWKETWCCVRLGVRFSGGKEGTVQSLEANRSA